EHHFQTQRSATRSDLCADESTADHDHAGARAEAVPDGQTVLDRAEHQYPVGNIASLPWDGDRTVCNHESVESQRQILAVIPYVDSARRHVEPERGRTAQ